MKYCIFSKMLMEFSPEEVAEKLQDLGYDGVEWRVHEEGHITLDEVAKKAEDVGRITKSHNLEIVNLLTYLLVENTRKMEEVFEAAEGIGCSKVRLWPPDYDPKVGYWELYNRGQRGMEKALKLAEKYNIRVLFEIHWGTIISSVSSAYRWVERFDPKRVGVIFDAANMITEGREDWKLGLDILGDYLALVHCKNAAWFLKKEGQRKRWDWGYVPLDEGIVDWEEVISIIRQRGYDGYLSNEDHSDIPVSQKLEKNLDYLKKIVENLPSENAEKQTEE